MNNQNCRRTSTDWDLRIHIEYDESVDTWDCFGVQVYPFMGIDVELLVHPRPGASMGQLYEEAVRNVHWWRTQPWFGSIPRDHFEQGLPFATIIARNFKEESRRYELNLLMHELETAPEGLFNARSPEDRLQLLSRAADLLYRVPEPKRVELPLARCLRE